MSANIFTPVSAGVGGPFKEVYTYTDPVSGCINWDTAYTKVIDRPVVSFTGLSASYCIYDPSSVITVNHPREGILSGIGFSDSTFSPVAAGVGGPYWLTYKYTDASTGCFNQDSQRTVVYDRPTVSFIGLRPRYCIDGSASFLSGTPAGGSFAGRGISANRFDPAAAGVGGPYAITYTYTNPGTGCDNTDTQYVSIDDKPVVSISGLASSYCIYDSAARITLSPPGGALAGTGIIGTNFNPPTAGVGGPYMITYNYTSPLTGCFNGDTIYTSVNARPVVSISGLASQYCYYDSAVSLVGIPSGGIFSGARIVGNVVTPSTLAPGGPYFVLYQYTDTSTGCYNNDSVSTIINDRPLVNINPIASHYCVNAPSVALSANPRGGVYAGTGISGSSFVPSLAGVGGPYAITYFYQDSATGCTNLDTIYTRVDTLPMPTFSGLPGAHCIYDGPDSLIGSPPGGIFVGRGVLGNRFYPSRAGIGVGIPIVYLYLDSASGCSNTDTQRVNIYGRPTVSVSGLAPRYCVNAPTETLSFSPANGTLSGPGLTGAVFNPSDAGVGGPYYMLFQYTDTITSCFNQDSIATEVVALPTPYFNGLDSAYCVNNGDVALRGIPLGGTFRGMGISGTTFSPSVAGVGGPYWIYYSYTDGNTCSNIDSSQVRVWGLPIANAGPDDTICPGGIATLAASGGWFYQWSPGSFTSQTINVTPLLSGTQYTVTVTDSHYCASTDSVKVFITAISINTTSFDATCPDGEDGGGQVFTPIGVAPFTYEWSDPLHQRLDTVRGLSVGVYRISVTDASGCVAVDSITIHEPPPIITYAISSNLLCYGDTNGTLNLSSIGGSPGYTYSYVLIDSNRTYTGSSANNLGVGYYDGTTTDSRGCRGTFYFEITQPLPMSLEFIRQQPRCFGYDDGSLFLLEKGGVPPYTFTLDGSANNTGWFDFLTQGNYHFDITDANNCKQQYDIFMPEPAPMVADINPDTLRLDLGSSGQLFTTFTGAPADSVSYIWSNPEGLNCADCANPVVNSYVNQVYEVTILNTSDVGNPRPCKASALCYVYVGNEPPVYVPNAFTPNGDGVNDVFLVYGSEIKLITVQIYDRIGEKLFESHNQLQGWDGTYKGTLLQPGVYAYYITIEFLNGKTLEKEGSVTMIR
jgi:gliding motility-associated-like protein